MTLYTDRKPREAVARAIDEAGLQWLLDNFGPGIGWSDIPAEVFATAALNTLRELGFITSEGLDAIHAEEDANGEPRSTVVPGERK